MNFCKQFVWNTGSLKKETKLNEVNTTLSLNLILFFTNPGTGEFHFIARVLHATRGHQPRQGLP